MTTIFNLDPLPGSAVFETNSTFVFPIIDLLFGGPGHMPRETREVTDIEANVLKNLNGKMLENLIYVWADVIEISPTIQSVRRTSIESDYLP